MSGWGAKAARRYSEKSPRELKAQEGIEWLAGLNLLSAATDHYSDEYPEGQEGEALASLRRLSMRRLLQRTRGYGLSKGKTAE
jgi:hypothetical protein